MLIALATHAPPQRPARRSPPGSLPHGDGPGRLALETGPVSPPCRLRLEGGDTGEARCEILALSADGATIVLGAPSAARRGQQGRLLIGPPNGDHYALPVAVTSIRPAASAWVMELAFATAGRWTYNRGSAPPPAAGWDRNG
jgi:hypothetical protein